MLLKVKFNILHQHLPVRFRSIQTATAPAEADPYKGEYDVTPTFDTQTLDTTGKLMNDNVKVYPIPVERVSNTAGGYTIIVGG